MLLPLFSGSACVQDVHSQTQQPAIAPTPLELEALQKLRETLSAGAGKPPRAFTSVRDVFLDPAEGACPSLSADMQAPLLRGSAFGTDFQSSTVVHHPVLNALVRAHCAWQSKVVLCSMALSSLCQLPYDIHRPIFALYF